MMITKHLLENPGVRMLKMRRAIYHHKYIGRAYEDKLTLIVCYSLLLHEINL